MAANHMTTDDIDLESLTLGAEERAALLRFDFVRFTMSDMHGVARCKAVPRRHVEHAALRGVDIYCGVLALGPRSDIVPVKEIVEVGYGNAVMRPLPGTLRPLPWATGGKFKVGEILCETFWTPPFKAGGRQAACPRYMARQQLDRLGALGYSLMSSFEAEFVARHKGGLVPLFEGRDIFSTLDLSQHEAFLYAVDAALLGAGVDVGVIHTEYAAGQFEMAVRPSMGVEGADQMFRLKHGLKEMGAQQDIHVSFMTRSDEYTGCGLHFNHSLWSLDGKTNLFHDPSHPSGGGLSPAARHWLAGLVAHAPALTALCSPTVNCYRRLHTPWAPDRADWGPGDRQAAFRVKTLSAHETYVENRLSAGGANPYLVLAATVAAGIAGLAAGLECPPQRGGEEGARLPGSLGEALDALEGDKVLGEALGEEFVRWFVAMKREEVVVLKEGVLEEEHKMYYKLL